ncbi:MAG: 7-cyano-7-deazaguanine synthase [Alphaproteobacteria bacterium]
MRVILCHSGGLDSTVCMLDALAAGHDVISLGFDYGQRARVELTYARRQCERYSVPRQTIHVRWRHPPRQMPHDRSIDDIRQKPSSGFLPSRNAIFLALASAEAAGHSADEVWVGLNYRDSPGYPDCQPSFLNSFRHMLETATNRPPTIHAPLLELTKPEIATRARAHGLTPADVWSCYRPIRRKNREYLRCNKCDGCRVSNHAWST